LVEKRHGIALQSPREGSDSRQQTGHRRRRPEGDRLVYREALEPRQVKYSAHLDLLTADKLT
jgi:hypothetical protein